MFVDLLTDAMHMERTDRLCDDDESVNTQVRATSFMDE